VDVEEEADEADVAVGIPGYWAQCLVNHPAIEDICTHEGKRDSQYDYLQMNFKMFAECSCNSLLNSSNELFTS
jgi:hypothetical protein